MISLDDIFPPEQCRDPEPPKTPKQRPAPAATPSPWWDRAARALRRERRRWLW